MVQAMVEWGRDDPMIFNCQVRDFGAGCVGLEHFCNRGMCMYCPPVGAAPWSGPVSLPCLLFNQGCSYIQGEEGRLSSKHLPLR